MFGIEVIDISRFLMQASAGICGATSLWGFVFWMKGRKDNGKGKSFRALSRIVFLLFLASITVFLTSWIYTFFAFIPNVFAHEGIVIKPQADEIIRGFMFNLPLVAMLTLISFFGIIFFKSKSLFDKYGGIIFLSQFFLISLILLFGAKSEFLRDQIFYSLHGWHSIITLGTVATIDTLYIATFKNNPLKSALYPFFPIMSAAIWIGLGIDFASVFLIVKDTLHVTTQFLFNQMVVGIIVINGAFLSGKINDLLIGLIHPDRVESLSPKMNIFFGISGSLSIVSWTTITFLDFVNLPFSYAQFLLLYISVVIVAFFAHLAIEKAISARKVIPSVV